MVNKAPEGERFNWQLRLFAVLGTLIVFIAAATNEPDLSVILYVVFLVPSISVIFLINTIRKNRRQRLLILSLLVIFWAVSAATIENYSAVRTATNWLVWSHRDKLKVLALAPFGPFFCHLQNWLNRECLAFHCVPLH